MLSRDSIQSSIRLQFSLQSIIANIPSSETVLAAQENAEALLEFIIAKSKLFDRLRGSLNQRQGKAFLSMFQEGPSGFTGGMSAEKYISITGASRATATRDLQDLLGKDALKKTGQLKGTRYRLNIKVI